MTSALDITRAVNPPRATFLELSARPYFWASPNEPELNTANHDRDARGAPTSMTKPGSIKMLPFVKWSEDDKWKSEAFAGDDTRTGRVDTPQYQSEEDRIVS